MPDPLHQIHRNQEGVSFRPYGPTNQPQTIQIVESFGAYEAEYAAIRKSVALMDWPQSGLIEITGNDRLDFLHRMITQDTRRLSPGQLCRGFLLNKTGRIIADLLVLHSPDRTRLVLDRFDAQPVVTELDKYLFSEDVQLKNITDQYIRLSLFGPESPRLLASLCNPTEPPPPMHHLEATLADVSCQLYRYDETGSPSLHLLVPHDDATRIYELIIDQIRRRLPTRMEPSPARTQSAQTPTPPTIHFTGAIGWEAYNTARIEAGHPRYHIDFGPDSLPHETGILNDAVSFTKGCYLGQEIVARMHSLGHPKRALVGLKLDSPLLPIAASQVFTPSGSTAEQTAGSAPEVSSSTGAGPGLSQESSKSAPAGEIIGAITSSTISPMLGGTAIAFAMIKWGHHTPDTPVLVPAQGQLTPARVHSLRFIA